jgi:hypothetical protein
MFTIYFIHQKILKKIPNERIRLDEVKNHKWMTINAKSYKLYNQVPAASGPSASSSLNPSNLFLTNDQLEKCKPGF